MGYRTCCHILDVLDGGQRAEHVCFDQRYDGGEYFGGKNAICMAMGTID